MATELENIAEQLKAERLANIDKSTGAPAGVRLSVGSAKSDKDKIATGKKFYPDFRPYGEDNFIYTDPRTNRPTIYNPSGFQPIGDTFSVAPEIAQTAAGAGTAALATLISKNPTLAPFAFALGSQASGTGAEEFLSSIGNRVDTRTLPQKYSDQAVGFATDMVGERLGLLAGDFLNKTVKQPISNALSRVLNPSGQARREAFETINVQPRASSVTDSDTIRIMEQGLSELPGSATTIRTKAAQELADVEAAADRVGRSYTTATNPLAKGSPDQTSMGSNLQEGIIKGAKQLRERTNQLYTNAYNVIPRKAVIPEESLSGINAIADQLAEKSKESDYLAGVYAPIISKIRKITGSQADDSAEAMAALESGTLSSYLKKKKPGSPRPTFEALKNIRTELNRLTDPNPFLMAANNVNATEQAFNKQIATQIKKVLDGEAAKYTDKATGRKGVELIAKADNFAKRVAQRNETIIRFIDQRVPEKVLRAILGEGNIGPSVIQGIRRQLELTGQREVFDDLAGTILGQLGRATPANDAAGEVGAATAKFSADRFLTNFNRLNQSGAAKALFGGTRYKNLVKPLNKLAKVTELVKGSDKLANRSGTARVLTAMGIITAGPTAGMIALTQLGKDAPDDDAGGMMQNATVGETIMDVSRGALVTAGTLLSVRQTARLLSSPRFVNWLSNYSLATSEKAASRLLARLGTIAKAEPELEEAINGVRAVAEGEVE